MWKVKSLERMNKNSCSLEVTQSSNSRIVKYLTKTTQIYCKIKYPRFVQNMILAKWFLVLKPLRQLEEQNRISEPKTKVKGLITNDLRLIKSCLFVHM